MQEGKELAKEIVCPRAFQTQDHLEQRPPSRSRPGRWERALEVSVARVEGGRGHVPEEAVSKVRK